ncbi:heavy-metal-associated domain-containing protein [Actinomadura sp. GC306]|uniref:heavy-metal-associated domain-containing protein n=1 Tax=Actinomadura sp. GC306 TaxID=2530367 RepID=UPI00104AC16F|nr:heavy-metal-associated domain-containing protein [Actinomadura sp. GC306]TDC70221.1 heavy-metal-associated domain-containing protein [Actinomadura sp. GC306]
MISTTFRIAGMTTAADARAVKDRLSAVPDIGAVATELVPGGDALVILKHKDDVVLDRAALQAALRDAGDYTLS